YCRYLKLFVVTSSFFSHFFCPYICFNLNIVAFLFVYNFGVGSTGNYGIYAIYNCNPVLGNTYYGQNSIYGHNGPEVYAAYYCNVAAEKNWWGSDSPSPSEFSASSSTIDYDPYLLSEPSQNQGRSIVPSNGNDKYLPVFSITSSQGDDLSLAEEKLKDGKYDEAINLFLEVFKKEKENSKGRYALIKIEECFTQAGKKDFLDFSKKELKPLIKEETELYVALLELETHQLYNMGYKDNAMNNLQTILKKYNYNTEIEKQTLYRIGVFYLDLYNDKLNAQKTFDELAVRYPNDELLTYANLVLNEERYNIQGSKNTDQKVVTVIDEELNNYPNPFNPITKISFTLASKDNIKLKVYDILGREVATLVNGEFELGKHEIEFNASNLPSGVYFYNLTTSSNSSTKKMLLLK
ncbi:MAG: T9SS type A sorting domain-containing protein, partial [Bacteroidota bacterium]